MVLGNTPRRETSFMVEASKSFAFGIQFKDLDDQPHDLQDVVVRLVMAQPLHLGGTEVLTTLAQIVDSSSGYVQFNLQAEDLALTPASYLYDVTLLPLNNYSIPVLKGFIEVGSNVDLDTSNVYGGVIPPPANVIQIVLDRGQVT